MYRCKEELFDQIQPVVLDVLKDTNLVAVLTLPHVYTVIGNEAQFGLFKPVFTHNFQVFYFLPAVCAAEIYSFVRDTVEVPWPLWVGSPVCHFALRNLSVCQRAAGVQASSARGAWITVLAFFCFQLSCCPISCRTCWLSPVGSRFKAIMVLAWKEIPALCLETVPLYFHCLFLVFFLFYFLSCLFQR